MPRIPFVVYSDDGIPVSVVVVLCYRVEMQFIRSNDVVLTDRGIPPHGENARLLFIPYRV